MIDEGIIAPSNNGFFHLLPLAVRSLEKLTRLIDKHMAEIGAQKISCPTLTASSVWEKTGKRVLQLLSLTIESFKIKKTVKYKIITCFVLQNCYLFYLNVVLNMYRLYYEHSFSKWF